MKGMSDEPDPSKELFNLINFDGRKVVQEEGDLFEVDWPDLTCMLCTFHGENTYFSDKVNWIFWTTLLGDTSW